MIVADGTRLQHALAFRQSCTFCLRLDKVTGDLADNTRTREAVPDFSTHLERYFQGLDGFVPSTLNAIEFPFIQEGLSFEATCPKSSGNI